MKTRNSDPYSVCPMSEDPVVQVRGPWVIEGPDGEEGPLYFDRERAAKKCEALNANHRQQEIEYE